jgi:hypothetical protein
MRTLVKLVLAVVVVLVVAWLGLWWYAEGRLQAGITNWAEQMAANGNGDVKVSYSSMTRGTSPFAATVTLANLQVTAQTSPVQPPFSVALPSFALRIDAANPLLLHFDLPNQVNISGERGDGVITFGNIDVAEHIDPQSLFNPNVSPLRGGDIQAGNINLLASSGSLLVLHADSYTEHDSLNQAAGAGQTAFATSFTLEGMAVSPLLARLASIPFGGRIGHLALSLKVSGPLPPNLPALLSQLKAGPAGQDDQKQLIQAVHAWAAQGGSANGSLGLAIGPSTLASDGALKFDANEQPAGTANLTADHLDAFTAAITKAYPQVQNTVNTLEARLSPYLSSTNTSGQTLALHVTYGSGNVNINGQPVGTLPAINWATLENPPAQAPGDGSGAAAQ